MKSKFPLCILLASLSLILLVVSGISIYSMRENLVIEEEILIGNRSSIDNVNIRLTYEDNDLFWDTRYRLGTNQQMDSKFHYTLYDKDGKYVDERIRIDTSHDFFRHDYYGLIEEDVGSVTVNVSEYYEYVPINMWVNIRENRVSSIADITDYYKVNVPKDASLKITKEYNGYSLESEGIPYVDAPAPSVRIGNKIYFTIQNRSKYIYDKSDTRIMEYELTSGILAIDSDKVVDNKATIEKVYPITMNEKSNITILGLSNVKEENYLALATIERNEIYIHIFDVYKNALIRKELVGSIPANMELLDFKLLSQEEYLLVHYQYMEQGDREYTISEKVGAVFKLNEKNNIDVCLVNEYLSEFTDEQREKLYQNPIDMIYQNGILHLLARYYQTTGDSYNSIQVIALGEEDVLYAGIVRNNMIEDFTIGDISNNHYMLIKNRINNRNRMLNDVKFER